MRILFVAPYPPSRIRTRSYGFLNELRREHQVTVLVQVWSKQELADVEALRNQGYEVLAVRESRLQALGRTSCAVMDTASSLQVAYARSQPFLQEAQRLCSERYFDIVHVEHLRGMASVEPLAHTHPLVWDAVDCISLLAKQAAQKGPGPSVRSIAAVEYKRTRRYEADLLARHIHTITTSVRDRHALLDVYHRSMTHPTQVLEPDEDTHCDVIPCGVDLEYFCPQPFQERRSAQLVFFGKMSYHANIATALYLSQQIMPRIWLQRPEVRLSILGSNPPPAIWRLTRDPRIEVTGYVADIRPYIRRAQIMLSPMLYSTGIQNKVLEAMALGTPTIVTAQSAASMHVRPERDLLVAQTPQDFADSTLRLLEDKTLHTTLSQCGRLYVEQYHNWRAMTKLLVQVYQQVMVEYACRHASLAADAPFGLEAAYERHTFTG